MLFVFSLCFWGLILRGISKERREDEVLKWILMKQSGESQLDASAFDGLL
jgi:hypothetical protein